MLRSDQSSTATTSRLAIHSVPRSGSTWLGQIFDSSPHTSYAYQPLFSYAFKDALDGAASRDDIVAFFAAIAASDDAFVRQREAVAEGLVSSFAKRPTPAAVVYKEVRYHHLLEHLLATDDELRVIGLVRHPLAVLDSWRRAPREFREDLGWDFLAEWRSGASKNEGRPENFFGFDRWRQVATLFASLERRFADRFRLVRYADLLAAPLPVARELFAFADLPFTAQTEAFITASTSRDSDATYSVFRTKTDDSGYRGRLPQSVQDEVLAELAGTALARFLA